MILTRRTFLLGGAVGGTTGLYTWLWEPHWLEIVRRDLPIRHLPTDLAGTTVVQLSDIHVGPRMSDDYIVDTFRRVAALEPDLVVYTGDLTSHHRDLVPHAERVYASAPLGRLATFGILGNHDYGPGWAHPEIAARVTAVVEAAGIRVLRNAIADVGGLQIVGLDDLWAKRFDVRAGLSQLDRARAAVVLSHNPDTVDRPGWEPFRGWILAGHTHGGQCKPPFLPPPILPVQNPRYAAGVVDANGGRTLYINRGVGHFLPVRFNVRPEVTVFTLQRA